MTTTTVSLTGKISWAKLTPQNADKKFDPAGAYVLNFYPQSQKTWDTIQKAGLQLQTREDDMGKFITLRRRHEQVLKGETVVFGPPPVTKNSEPFTGLIGNGSLARVGLTTFDTRRGKGHRLNSVDILELVEYNKKNTLSDTDETGPELPSLD